MGEVIEEGEEDGEGLLDPEEAVEGPFAVELVDGVEVGVVASEARVRHNVLAGVFAFGVAGPEEEAAVDSFKAWSVTRTMRGAQYLHTD